MDETAPERARRHPLVPPQPGATSRDLAAIAPRLVASWQRSQDYGVSLDDVDPVFSGSYDEQSLFFTCGQEVLQALHSTVAAEPLALMLTDADGRVLVRQSGDTSLLRALDRVHLAPGFAYSEREAGTNGLGLALADKVPSVVRAEEHYVASLCSYTCAAAPVLSPATGRLEGSVNITTWSQSSTDLLLALAQSAAAHTSAAMLNRSGGRTPRASPRGQVFRVETQLEPGSGTLAELSTTWRRVVDEARRAMAEDHCVLAVGEPGSGRATALAQAHRAAAPRDRILCARTPAPEDTEVWLDLWSPELGKPHTAVVVGDVDELPAWAAQRLRDLVVAAGPGNPRVCFTAQRYEDVAGCLTELVDAVVHVAPLRERPDDVVPLAHHLAQRARGRPVDFTAAAEHALATWSWPDNVAQLRRVVREAATRTDLVDVRHLPGGVLTSGSRRLTRVEAFERDEIIRLFETPGRTMKEIADELGVSRATLYRKVAAYGISHPR